MHFCEGKAELFGVVDVQIHILLTLAPQFHTLPASPVKEPPVHIDKEARWAPIRYGRYGEVKILNHTGIRTPTTQSSNPQQVAILTTLRRILKRIAEEYGMKMWNT
jgi:hypothetical protein